MIAKALKAYFSKTVKLPNIRVKTSSGKAGWVTVWIAPNPNPDLRAPLAFPAEFPEPVRKACLRIAYPQSTTLQAQVTGGNIQRFSLALVEPQWRTFLTEMGHPYTETSP